MTEPSHKRECPVTWCARTDQHVVHTRVLYETVGGYQQTVAVCMEQLDGDEPELDIYTHSRDMTIVGSLSLSREQATQLTRALAVLDPAQTIALTGTLGAAVSLLGEGVPA